MTPNRLSPNRKGKFVTYYVTNGVALLVLVGGLLLGGCSTPAGRGSRLLPWNWFAPDRVAQLEKAEAKNDEAAQNLGKSAQEDVRAAKDALAKAPDSLAVATARQFNNRADAKLGEVFGPLTVAKDLELQQLVDKLCSDLPEINAEGINEMLIRDRAAMADSEALRKSRESIADLTDKLKTSDLKYQATAEKYRRVLFWIGLAVGGFLLLQVLSGLAKFYPSLAPVANLAGRVVAPAIQAASDKLHRAVGKAIAEAEKAADGSAAILRKYLDATTDEDHQETIRKSYEVASRT